MTPQDPKNNQPVRGSDDEAVLVAVTKMLDARSKNMAKALRDKSGEALKDGKHLDDGTPEQAYWHAGYVTAMKDALRMIQNRETEWPISMKGHHS